MKHVACLLMAILIVAGCGNQQKKYIKEVNENLKIEYVYNLPNNAFGPYTLLRYTKKSGYTRAIPAERLTGMDSTKYKRSLKEYDIMEFSVKRSASMDIPVNLQALGLGSLETKVGNENYIRLKLTDGKQYEMEISLDTVMQNLKNEYCLRELKHMLEADPKSEFILTTTVYGYDIACSICNKNNVEAEIELSELEKKLIIEKAGFAVTSGANASMTGKKLFIGFNGFTQSFERKNGEDKNTVYMASKGFATPEGDNNKTALDLTNMIKESIRLADIK